ASQTEMARSIGKSEAWVSRLLKWHRSGDKDESPFGPTTKAGRLAHAKDRAASGAAKPRNLRKANAELQTNRDDAESSAAQRKAWYAEKEAAVETASSNDSAVSPAEARENLIQAIDRWWLLMDEDGRHDMIHYFNDKAEAWLDSLGGAEGALEE